MIRVLVVHNVRLIRSALVALLRSETALDVSSTSGRTAFRTAHGVPSHVCVADIDCLDSLGREGVASTRGDLDPEPALLVLATAREAGRSP